MRRESRAQATREHLLDAAAHVLETLGAEHFTLDEVAKEAKVSKGGLLYHFATKNALLLGLIERSIQEGEAMAEECRKGRTGPGSWSEAHIEMHAHEKFGKDGCGPNKELILSIIGASASDRTLLEPIRKAFDRWNEACLNDGIDPVTATVVRLACDGMGSAEIFGFAAPTPAFRKQIFDRLHQMLREAKDQA